MTFDEAFKVLIGHEGGYVNDPRDPGGETKFGISKRAWPQVDIKALTLKEAKAIYYANYWLAAGCDKVVGPVRFDLFDAAVNSGVSQAVKWLQEASGVAADGRFGPRTLSAVQACAPLALVARFNGHRLRFMAALNTWPSFGRGWARRIAANLTRAEVR